MWAIIGGVQMQLGDFRAGVCPIGHRAIIMQILLLLTEIHYLMALLEQQTILIYGLGNLTQTNIILRIYLMTDWRTDILMGL